MGFFGKVPPSRSFCLRYWLESQGTFKHPVSKYSKKCGWAAKHSSRHKFKKSRHFIKTVYKDRFSRLYSTKLSDGFLILQRDHEISTFLKVSRDMPLELNHTPETGCSNNRLTFLHYNTISTTSDNGFDYITLRYLEYTIRNIDTVKLLCLHLSIKLAKNH